MPNRFHYTHGKDHFDVLPVDIEYVTEELQIRAKQELHEENEKTRIDGLKSLRSMLKGEINLRWQDEDEFLIAFLRAKKYDVKKTFNLVKGLYNTFGRHGHIYYNMSFDRLRFIMEENSSSILSYRNYDGSIVVYFRFTNWNPNVISAEEHMAVVSIGLMQALRSPTTQVAGVHVIGDFKDITLRQFMTISPSFVWFFAEICGNSIPVRIPGLHVINETYLFHPLWTIAKRFLTKKLVERVHFHGKDYKKLHKFVDSRILPAELGGMQPPYNNDGWREKVEASFDYLKHVLSFGYKKYLKEK